MKVIDISQAKTVISPDGAFTSHRFLLDSDGMGFTITKTFIPKGGPWHWHYKKHLEACLCVSGRGILYDSNTCKRYNITPDVMYALDKNDSHLFHAIEDTILICVFNPPLKGNEVHKEDGSYE